MITAIHYTSVKKPTEKGQIYGLQVAVLDWLRAYLRHTRQEKIPFLIGAESSEREIRDTAQEIGFDPARLAMLDSRFAQNLIGVDAVFRCDPFPQDLFWQRGGALAEGKGIDFAFCGIAHAISGRRGAEMLSLYCTGPTTEADAIICPSRAVRDAIARHWEHYAHFLSLKFGAHYQCPVQLPVLPLGVDTARIAARVSPEKRKTQRERLNIGADDIVVLWVGRLSHAIKAHPIAMFRAVEEAARRTGKNVHLVMQGYFVPEEAANDFLALAKATTNHASVIFVSANDTNYPDGLWAAGDIFISLIDNMQESFGLTPIEAIAAGLPRVISDWDGYRDGVTDGEDGFLIPTVQPPPGMGDELAGVTLAEREEYAGYLGKTAQCVAVDVETAVQALVRLIDSPDLRARIAAKAKERLPNYDWAKLIPAYEDLWAELAAKRKAQAPLPFVHPHVADPFRTYEGFASRRLAPTDRLTLTMGETEINGLLRHDINRLAFDMMVKAETLPALLSAIGRGQGQTDIAALCAQFPKEPQAALYRTLAWLMKLGIVR